MLKAPAFVDPFGDEGFSETGQVWCVIHAHFNSVWKIPDERREKGGT